MLALPPRAQHMHWCLLGWGALLKNAVLLKNTDRERHGTASQGTTPANQKHLWEVRLATLATSCLKNVETVWENKMGLKEQKAASSIGCYRWKIEINSIYWLLKVVMSYTLMPLWHERDLFFFPKRSPSLWELPMLHVLFLSWTSWIAHKLSMISRMLTKDAWLTPDLVTMIISEVRLCLFILLGPIWTQFWGLVLPLVGWQQGSICLLLWDRLALSEICLS